MDLDAALAWFLQETAVAGLSTETARLRKHHCSAFVEWASERGLTTPGEVTLAHLYSYRRYLFYKRKADGTPLSARSQVSALNCVKAFFSFLAKRRVIESNPAGDLEIPKIVRPLPRDVLTEDEAEAVLATPDVDTTLGLRDRAMLETFYASAIRRSELCRLGVSDVDFSRGTIFVAKGKGGASRFAPAGARALSWIARYLDDSRPRLAIEPDPGALFITNLGKAFEPGSVSRLAKRYVDAAEIGKSGACHIFRHSAATLMLDHGAELRYIQEMLGHAEIATTQIYTRVSIEALKRVHQATHPGASVAKNEDDVS